MMTHRLLTSMFTAEVKHCPIEVALHFAFDACNLEQLWSGIPARTGNCYNACTKLFVTCSTVLRAIEFNLTLIAGDADGLRTARAYLSCGIRKAKSSYAKKITGDFEDSIIQTVMDYKPLPQTCDSNSFFARFEAHNSMPQQKTTRPPPHDQALCLTAASVKRTLSKRSYNIPRHVLKDCAEELKDVFTDPYQFAYRGNRSTEDAIFSALHLALTHLDTKNSYVRMLFIDFSSAFNTIIPQQLICKLDQLGLSTSLCNWLLDLLSGRPQAVRVGSNTSRTTILSTGAPQGCVLSPLIFTLLTHDCAPFFSSNHTVKFADDTTVVVLISNNDETHYRKEVSQLVTWCRGNNLFLNIDKTKEVFIDFRRGQTPKPPTDHYFCSALLWV
ncbi:hypothetical protein F2P81_006463 [Scophthalmus maximus]|uniref:Reverse transcriptase domain-containing protein n=1 Tax=Scophthalmus maximus TaxID=52904 RepID=A0A6A4T603_SCOMX|nr:hypothetical protein F2P81_006463 [Scophthalmus maximus]